MNQQPRLGEVRVCPNPHCGSGAIRRLEDKYGPFIVCMSCGHNSERIAGPKRLHGRRK